MEAFYFLILVVVGIPFAFIYAILHKNPFTEFSKMAGASDEEGEHRDSKNSP